MKIGEKYQTPSKEILEIVEISRGKNPEITLKLNSGKMVTTNKKIFENDIKNYNKL